MIKIYIKAAGIGNGEFFFESSLGGKVRALQSDWPWGIKSGGDSRGNPGLLPAACPIFGSGNEKDKHVTHQRVQHSPERHRMFHSKMPMTFNPLCILELPGEL